MDILMQLLDFVIHVDRHLETFVTQYGVWIYALLFLIVFVETGLVVMPFLPGDSLLFVTGTLCGAFKCGQVFSSFWFRNTQAACKECVVVFAC